MSEKEQEICKTCAHYWRHYLLHKDRATAVNCGHCVAGRLKKRKPDDIACEYYEYCDHSTDLPDRREVVDFLSTEFLQWVQAMVLPLEVDRDEGFESLSAKNKSHPNGWLLFFGRG